MSTDLFFTEAWFDLLRYQGLEQPPHAQQTLELPGKPGKASPRLHLMQGKRGGGWAALSNYYSGLYGPVGDVSHLSSDDWAQAARQVRRWPGGGLVTLDPLDGQSAWLSGLEQGWQQAGYRVWREPAFGNWYQPVEPGAFAAYWRARPSALRNTVGRAQKRLDKAGDWRIDIWAPGKILKDSADMDLNQMIEAYLQVYALSWKPREPNAEFMPAFIRLAAAHGCLRLGVLWRFGEPLAAQLWLVYPGRSAQIYKLAYVQGQERWSAGSVLTAVMAERAIDIDQVVELDYVSGDDAYKVDWMSERRERLVLTAVVPWSRAGLSQLVRHGWRLRSGKGKR